MRKHIVTALRILETLLLVGVGYSLRKSMAEVTGSFFFLRITFDVSVAHYAEAVVLHTTVFGYMLSQIATMLTPSDANGRAFRWSLVLSLFGIISFVLELVRFFVGYEIRVLTDTAAALVLVDWVLTRAMWKQAAGRKRAMKEAVASAPRTEPAPSSGSVQKGHLKVNRPTGQADNHGGGHDDGIQ